MFILVYQPRGFDFHLFQANMFDIWIYIYIYFPQLQSMVTKEKRKKKEKTRSNSKFEKGKIHFKLRLSFWHQKSANFASNSSFWHLFSTTSISPFFIPKFNLGPYSWSKLMQNRTGEQPRNHDLRHVMGPEVTSFHFLRQSHAKNLHLTSHSEQSLRAVSFDRSNNPICITLTLNMHTLATFAVEVGRKPSMLKT